MNFYEFFFGALQQLLKKTGALTHILERIEVASQKGKIAFYPCGRYAGILLSEIRKNRPQLLPHVLGCFDSSLEAKGEKEIPVFHISRLKEFQDKISLLVVASNTYFSRELRDLETSTRYNGEILKTSYFEYSLPCDLNSEELMAKIGEVYQLLADDKSRMTYMIFWLSRLMNDECMTSLFSGEQGMEDGKELAGYGNFKIEGLDAVCARELKAELYQMEHVFPEKGDVVFDVGAYKGDTPIFFAAHVGRSGKIYAFEPIPANYDVLVNNIQRNDLGDLIIPIPKGCSDKEGTLRAVSSTSGAPWSFLSDDRGDAVVSVTTIDDFVASRKISKLDFIKVDVEGFEENVLLGSVKTLRQFHPKLAVALYHHTSDLITLPLRLHRMGGYKIYIRSKIEGPFGLTLYAT